MLQEWKIYVYAFVRMKDNNEANASARMEDM